MRGICAFCGIQFGPLGSPHERTGEHALPQWLLGVMPGSGTLTYKRQSTPYGPVDQIWSAEELTITARQVCKACNGGWMNDLENEAKPFLTPMIQGRGRILHRDGQATVAAWAAKTALVLHLTTAEKGAPVEHYREMARTHRAPAQCYVWLAKYDARNSAAYHRSHVLHLTSSAFDAKGYATTFAVSHFVAQVVGYWDAPEEISIRKQGPGALGLLQFHPYQGRSLTFPTRLVLDEPALLRFADSMNPSRRG